MANPPRLPRLSATEWHRLVALLRALPDETAGPALYRRFIEAATATPAGRRQIERFSTATVELVVDRSDEPGPLS